MIIGYCFILIYVNGVFMWLLVVLILVDYSSVLATMQQMSLLDSFYMCLIGLIVTAFLHNDLGDYLGNEHCIVALLHQKKSFWDPTTENINMS